MPLKRFVTYVHFMLIMYLIGCGMPYINIYIYNVLFYTSKIKKTFRSKNNINKKRNFQETYKK